MDCLGGFGRLGGLVQPDQERRTFDVGEEDWWSHKEAAAVEFEDCEVLVMTISNHEQGLSQQGGEMATVRLWVSGAG